MPNANDPGTSKPPDTANAKGNSSPNSLESHVKSISLERLIQGFPLYLKTAREIVLRPTAFVTALDVNNEKELGKAIEFVSYGIVICFVLLIPALIAHNEKLSKVTFFAWMLTQFVIFGVVIHLALKMVGSRNVRLKGTATVYAYIVGLCTPLYIVVSYPLFLVLGKKAIFGTPTDFKAMFGTPTDIKAMFGTTDIREILLVMGLIVCWELVLGALSIYGLVLMIKFFSKSHGISGFRVCLAVFLGGAVMAPVQMWVLNPLFNIVSPWVDQPISLL